MIDETIVKQAATRHGRSGNLFELYLWFLGRVIATLLASLLAASILYLYFFNSNGLAGVDYTLIITRWTDPLWGGAWRGFDWMLVVWGVVIGRQMLVYWLTRANWSQRSKDLGKAALNIVGGVIVIIAAQIIFGFTLLS